jgi:hypothetical protein
VLPWQPQPTPLGDENQYVLALPVPRKLTGVHAAHPFHELHPGAIETRFGVLPEQEAVVALKLPLVFVPATLGPLTHWHREEEVGPVAP